MPPLDTVQGDRSNKMRSPTEDLDVIYKFDVDLSNQKSLYTGIVSITEYIDTRSICHPSLF